MLDRVALQLYTVRDEATKDMLGTLKKVRDIGYKAMEFDYILLKREDVLQELKKLQIKLVSIHTPFPELKNNISEVVSSITKRNIKYVVCSGDYKSAAEWRAFAADLNAIGKYCADAGLTYCYHNHAAEFVPYDGTNGLEIIYNETDPRWVQAEIDVYWVKRGGADPVEYVRRYADRCPLLHLKDMVGEDQFFAEVGEGILDFQAILKAADARKIEWYIVEQDQCRRPSLESAAISYRNIAALAQRL